MPQKQTSADEVGQINLGRAEINLPVEGGMARFTPQMMKTGRLGLTLTLTPYVIHS